MWNLKSGKNRRRLVWSSIGTVILLMALVGNWLWNTGRLQPWVQARLLETYLRLVAPQLPFTIESVEMNKDWSHLLRGQIPSLTLRLEHQGWRARLKGPVHFENPGSLLSGSVIATYKPETILQSPGQSPSPPIALDLTVVFQPKKLSFTQAHLKWKFAPAWKWKSLPGGGTIDIQSLNGKLTWKDNIAEFELKSGLSQYSSGQNAANLNSLEIQASSPLSFQPFSWEGPVSFRVQAGNAEILWNDFYGDLPLSRFPLQGQLRRNSLSLLLLPNQLNFSASQVSKTEWQTHWKTGKFDLPSLFQGLQKALPTHTKFLRSVELQKGTFFSEGSARIQLPWNPKAHPPRIALKRFEVTGLHLRWPEASFALHDFHLLIPEEESVQSGHHEGIISAETIAFRRLRAHLSPTSFEADGLTLDGQKPLGMTLGGLAPLALSVDDIPLEMGRIKVTWNPHSKSDPEPQILTSLKLDAVDASVLAKKFCIPVPRLPPAPVTAHFTQIEASPALFNPTGRIQMNLLGGTISIEELGGFDLASDVPEINFTIHARGIRLDSLGEFLNFGEMDGILQGDAQDVTFKSWLPTHYQFYLELKPLHHGDVVFSPEAMKNFVRIFAGGDIDYLPGVVDWWVFGWPQRVLGGYDIDYAGVQIESKDGFIILETLDPPSVLARYQKHFILFGGNRFKIPLRSARYPVILDATAMNNFLRHMSLQLSGLKKEKEEDHAASEPNCEPPN